VVSGRSLKCEHLTDNRWMPRAQTAISPGKLEKDSGVNVFPPKNYLTSLPDNFSQAS